MAATIKTTKILEVTVTDVTNEEYTFRIDNPRNDLTAAEVSNTFDDFLGSPYWLSPKTYQQINAYTKAEIVETTVVRHDVGEEP